MLSFSLQLLEYPGPKAIACVYLAHKPQTASVDVVLAQGGPPVNVSIPTFPGFLIARHLGVYFYSERLRTYSTTNAWVLDGESYVDLARFDSKRKETELVLSVRTLSRNEIGKLRIVYRSDQPLHDVVFEKVKENELVPFPDVERMVAYREQCEKRIENMDQGRRPFGTFKRYTAQELIGKDNPTEEEMKDTEAMLIQIEKQAALPESEWWTFNAIFPAPFHEIELPMWAYLYRDAFPDQRHPSYPEKSPLPLLQHFLQLAYRAHGITEREAILSDDQGLILKLACEAANTLSLACEYITDETPFDGSDKWEWLATNPKLAYGGDDCDGLSQHAIRMLFLMKRYGRSGNLVMKKIAALLQQYYICMAIVTLQLPEDPNIPDEERRFDHEVYHCVAMGIDRVWLDNHLSGKRDSPRFRSFMIESTDYTSAMWMDSGNMSVHQYFQSPWKHPSSLLRAPPMAVRGQQCYRQVMGLLIPELLDTEFCAGEVLCVVKDPESGKDCFGIPVEHFLDPQPEAHLDFWRQHASFEIAATVTSQLRNDVMYHLDRMPTPRDLPEPGNWPPENLPPLPSSQAWRYITRHLDDSRAHLLDLRKSASQAAARLGVRPQCTVLEVVKGVGILEVIIDPCDTDLLKQLHDKITPQRSLVSELADLSIK